MSLSTAFVISKPPQNAALVVTHLQATDSIGLKMGLKQSAVDLCYMSWRI